VDDLGAGLALDVTAPVVLALAAVVNLDLTRRVAATTAHRPAAVRAPLVVRLTLPASHNMLHRHQQHIRANGHLPGQSGLAASHPLDSLLSAVLEENRWR